MAEDIDRLLARSREHAWRFESAAALAAADEAARHPLAARRDVAIRIARGRALAVAHDPAAILELREALALAEQPGHSLDDVFEAGRALFVALFDGPAIAVAERAARQLAARARRAGYPAAGTFEAAAIMAGQWGRADFSGTGRLATMLDAGEIEPEAVGEFRAHLVYALADLGARGAGRLARWYLRDEEAAWAREILLGASSQAAFYLGRSADAVALADEALAVGITSGVEDAIRATRAWALYEAGRPVAPPPAAAAGRATELVRGSRAEAAAVAALAAGDGAGSAAWFDEAAALLAGRAEPYALRARYGAALARIAAGDGHHAGVELLVLEQLVGAAGMAPLQARIGQALRATGTRRAARRNGSGCSATGREHEVLLLVADGATTAEISRTLAIAPATVETLVGSAVRHLGARNRRQAASLVAATPTMTTVELRQDERVLVAALAGGASMPEAAARAGVSLRTAHRRLDALRTRLGARSTTQAVALAQISTTTGRISGRFEARL